LTPLIQIAWIIFLIWLLGAALTLVALRRQRFLRPNSVQPLTGADAPRVSILVPARNEERRVLAACVRSILAQDYPSFEVVTVDDRSTDATPLILRGLAAADVRLRVVAGTEPPRGWLGKPHALQQALDASRGEWVLATDADMIFHPSALRTAVAYAVERRSDALTLIPHFEAHTFWERVFVPTWGWGALVLFPPELVNRDGWPLALGLGGFFLIRRRALARVEGFAAVRADVLDDMRLAARLKASGGRLHAEYARALIRTRMYTNFAELWESSTKNWYAILGFSPLLTAATLLWMFSVGVLPSLLAATAALALIAGAGGEQWPRLLIPALAAHALHVLLLALVNRRTGVPARYAFAAPLGYALSCAVLLGSAFGVLTGRGVSWKGRKLYTREGVRPPRA
jgi:chlorobactene glucosyltransferase